MRSTNFTFRVPYPLRELLDERARQLGYPSVAAYLVGLIRYDMLTQKPHACTAELSKLNNREQDALDDEIASMFGRQEAVNGCWFEHRLAEAVEAAKSPEVKKERVIKRLLSRIGKGKGK
jgi:hypothetical protein